MGLTQTRLPRSNPASGLRCRCVDSRLLLQLLLLLLSMLTAIFSLFAFLLSGLFTVETKSQFTILYQHMLGDGKHSENV